MICPNCGSNMSDKRMRCERCGTDLTLYKKIINASNEYYNNGLARAKVRDLSGAICSLHSCLELNKKHTNARNLLGLIYYEMGETVAALSEWVISKHFKPEDNDADEYINKVQSNLTKLDNLNQAIKRYNNALTFAKQGSGDLAIIQLKKVIVLNPHFIRAYHLLTLLYMKDGENEKARRNLTRALKIDVSNTTTLRYLRELEAPADATDSSANQETLKSSGSASPIMPISSYKEDKPNIMVFVNLVIGIIIGLALFAVLIMPSITKKQKANENANYVNQNASLAVQQEKDAKINDLQTENDNLKDQVAKLQGQIDGFVIPEDKTNAYDVLFEAAQKYDVEQAKSESERDFTGIADILATIDEKQYGSDAAVALLTQLRTEIYPVVSEGYYQSGRSNYNRAKYEDAQADFEKAVKFDQENVDAIYYLGRSYDHLDNKDQATVYYNIVITDFPDSSRVSNAKRYLEQLQ